MGRICHGVPTHMPKTAALRGGMQTSAPGELPLYVGGDASNAHTADTIASHAMDAGGKKSSAAAEQRTDANMQTATTTGKATERRVLEPTPPLISNDDDARQRLLEYLQRMTYLIDHAHDSHRVLPRAALESMMFNMISALLLINPALGNGLSWEILQQCVAKWTAHSRQDDCTIHKLLQFFMDNTQASLAVAAANPRTQSAANVLLMGKPVSSNTGTQSPALEQDPGARYVNVPSFMNQVFGGKDGKMPPE